MDKLKNAVIISSQAMPCEPFYNQVAMQAMMQSLINGGAQGLRVAGARDVKLAKSLCDLPVIAITKPDKIPDNYKEVVYITPSVDDVKILAEAGADVIAFDGTLRNRPSGDSLGDIISAVHNQGCLAMADISTFEEGIEAHKLGADIVSTTLAGYTSHSEVVDGPDFGLLERLVKNLDCPVILEGRIWSPNEVKRAFDLGAYAVVIGSAVTRPHHIVQRFVEVKDQK
ncbi:MAG: N-acetylmannosamine-6-phosphate 2-epimerase [Candidatus Gastranaerophilales bacterium]|nr:N-acetylmannosamine-6-phosphate 2-epimerase [Candidatus Gastranaerophilales bacterium]